MSEMSSDPTGAPGHPDLEELASFIDQRLSARECDRVRQHIAHCADCYEIFRETLMLRRMDAGAEPGRVVPFPPSQRWVGWRWALAAAAAALVAVLGAFIFRALRPAPPLAVAALAEPLAPRFAGLRQEVWGQRTRGGGEPETGALLREQSFRLGVEVLNLQAALAADDRQGAESAAAQVNRLLGDVDLVDEKTSAFYRRLFGQLESPRPPHELAPDAARAAETGLRGAVLDNLYFDYGKWAEAGRLSALAREPSFFARPENRRFLAALRRGEAGAQPPEVTGALAAIDRRLAREPLGATDYAALTEAFGQILRAFYAGGEPSSPKPEPAPSGGTGGLRYHAVR
jgi:Putative zinc-finger